MTLKSPQNSSDSLQMASACVLSFLQFPCFCFQQCPQSLTHTSLPLSSPPSAEGCCLQSSVQHHSLCLLPRLGSQELCGATEGQRVALLWPGCAFSAAPSCPAAVCGTMAVHGPALQGDPAHSCLAFQSENTKNGSHSLIHLGVFC